MTKSSKAIGVTLVILTAFFVTACSVRAPNPGYQTFGTQPYPAGGDHGH